MSRCGLLHLQYRPLPRSIIQKVLGGGPPQSGTIIQLAFETILAEITILETDLEPEIF
jgi:hypothetical protein